MDEELASYVPETEQSLFLLRHSCDVTELTHRSLLPVSKCNRRGCAGVPIDALAKYNVCSLSNVSWRVF